MQEVFEELDRQYLLHGVHPAMAVDFSGEWKLETNDKSFDVFLKACGVSWAWRKAACSVKPTAVITQNGDDFVIVTKTSYRTQEVRFALGEEFLSVIPWEGVEYRMVAELDQAKLVIRVLDRDVSFTREIINNQLVLTLMSGDAAAKRVFTKVETE